MTSALLKVVGDDVRSPSLVTSALTEICKRRRKESKPRYLGSYKKMGVLKFPSSC